MIIVALFLGVSFIYVVKYEIPKSTKNSKSVNYGAEETLAFFLAICFIASLVMIYLETY